MKNRQNYDNFVNTLKTTIKGLNNSFNTSGITITYDTIAADVLNLIKTNNGDLHVKLNNELTDFSFISKIDGMIYFFLEIQLTLQVQQLVQIVLVVLPYLRQVQLCQKVLKLALSLWSL